MKSRILLAVSLLSILCAATFLLQPGSKVSADEGLKARVFEMRTYTTANGRLDVLHKRFREHTNYLFVKHGMTLIGYWTPTDKPETLVYILAYPNMDARKKSWKGFMGDEAWKKAWAASKEDGPVVTKVESQFLNPTDYSPIR
ncbi:MAG: NIPSNAP family protein [Planctomycetota bacterium]|nr:NIPSNAP family protein [Planctomycetota bacterium]